MRIAEAFIYSSYFKQTVGLESRRLATEEHGKEEEKIF
jgi:hypothetical protein